jgi:hypothetical protein
LGVFSIVLSFQSPALLLRDFKTTKKEYKSKKIFRQPFKEQFLIARKAACNAKNGALSIRKLTFILAL